MVHQQVQRLALSPQIRQYLKVLQLPLAELEQAVEQELAENPLLEEQASDDREESLDLRDGEDLKRRAEGDELKFGDSYNPLEQLDENFKQYYEAYETPLADPKDLQKRKDYEDTLLTKPQSLTEYLSWQIEFLDLNAKAMKIAVEIVGNIDENGYLQATVEEIATASGAEIPSVEAVLALVHELDPPGIGARDLREALLLQLHRINSPDTALALNIVTHHLPLLEKRDWGQLAKVLVADPGEVKKAAEQIAHLEPRPGRIFYAKESLAVVPDATVSFDDEKEDQLKIEIHSESVPELRISSYYRKLLRDRSLDRQTKHFLRDKLQAAMNFIRALQLRKSTLREITEEIVKAQRDFFEKGFSRLKPLRLKDISQALGIHESTVSRALHGKYIATPQGTIPYRSFFSSKLETITGEAESQKSIMEKMRTYIEKEDRSRPFSDQALVRQLREEGILIARRTVAKYRDLLKILPSHLRRQR